MSVTIAGIVRAASERFDAAGIDTHSLDAELLMRHLLGWDRVRYLMHRGEPMPDAHLAPYDALVQRRLARESIAYIVGEREFLGMPFAVGPGALVPRPETELLVEWAVEWLDGKRQRLAVDVGTGSGAIAVGVTTLAPPGSLTGVIAVEPSALALAWAWRNARRLAPDAPIAFVRASLLAALAGPIDLVLANLPYLTPEQLAENPDLATEPADALVSGPDGLDLIRALLADLPRILAEGGAAILELDPDQASTVAIIGRERFPGATVSIIPDLSDRARFVTIER
jgi:release factor glutamine methyltransferase